MSKLNKNQIEATLRNKIASQYTEKVKTLNKIIDEYKAKNAELYKSNYHLREENKELRNKIIHYENWINYVEPLPKSIIYKERTYYLHIYVNAWNKLTIGYYNSLNNNSILVYCVEEYKHSYIPKGFDNSEAILNENIGNDKTLNRCIKHIWDVISDKDNKNKFILNH